MHKSQSKEFPIESALKKTKNETKHAGRSRSHSESDSLSNGYRSSSSENKTNKNQTKKDLHKPSQTKSL